MVCSIGGSISRVSNVFLCLLHFGVWRDHVCRAEILSQSSPVR